MSTSPSLMARSLSSVSYPLFRALACPFVNWRACGMILRYDSHHSSNIEARLINCVAILRAPVPQALQSSGLQQGCQERAFPSCSKHLVHSLQKLRRQHQLYTKAACVLCGKASAAQDLVRVCVSLAMHCSHGDLCRARALLAASGLA